MDNHAIISGDRRMGITTNIRSTNDNRLDIAGATGEKEKELVVVEWRDIIATAGWEKSVDCPTLFSVGWLISEDEDTVLIANTKDPEDFMEDQGQIVYYGLTRFPAGVVVRLQHIPLAEYPIFSQILNPKSDPSG